MNFGVNFFPTDEAIDPATLGRMVEERGFDSLFVTEHTHIPVSRETPYPAGGELPREYFRTHDPLVALMAIAAATETIKVGTGICLVVERDPIVTAKQVASIDRISGGRMVFGVGAGWNLEEMRNHGTDPKKRFGLMRERVEAMREIWTKDEAEYHGEQVDFDPIYCWPKPLQEGGPPVLVGGNGPTVHDRVLAFGDGWYPNRIGDDDWLIEQVEALQTRAAAEGRGAIPVVLQIPPSDLSVLERYEKAGVTGVVHMLRPMEPSEVDAQLDKWAARRREYEGAAA